MATKATPNPAQRRSPAFVTSDENSSETSADDPMLENPRQAMLRELKERVARGEYWVDLDFLASLLVDSEATRDYLEEER